MSEEEQEYEAPEVEAEEQEETEAETYEDKARRWGWYPEGGELSAEEFVKRAEENLPLMRSQMKKLDERNRRMEQQVENLVAQMGTQRREAYEQAKRELVDQQRKAVHEGDVEAFERAARDMEDLNKRVQQQETSSKENPDGPDPDFQQALESFKEHNPWYGQAVGPSAEFEQVHDYLLRVQPELSHEKRFEMAKLEVARKYPEQFKNQRRDRPGAVSEPGSGKGKRDKSFSDIPESDRATFERILQSYPPAKRDEAKKRMAKRYFTEE